MSKRTLTASYTAPKHMQEFVAESRPEPHLPSYADQQYKVELDVNNVQTYKERMANRHKTDESRKRRFSETDQGGKEGNRDGGFKGEVDRDGGFRGEGEREEKGEGKNDGKGDGLIWELSDDHKSVSGLKSFYAQENSPGSNQQKTPAYMQETHENPPKQENSLSNQKNSIDSVKSNSKVELTDELLDQILPKGYIKASVPSEPMQDLLYIPPPSISTANAVNETLPEFEGIPMRKADVKHFSALINVDMEAVGYVQDATQLRAMALVFRAKNGSSIIRKKAMKGAVSKAPEYGAKAFLPCILPLFLEPSLDETDRHVLTKLLLRLLHPLGSSIKPYTHKIISAVSPLLIDENMALRLEARDLVSSLTRTVGLASIVTALRPDLDNPDEFIRNLTARVFAIVATTLGISQVVPFLKAVIKSRKNWHARHTGIRIIHHVCILLGGGNGGSLLPYLDQLVQVLLPGLDDDLVQVRTATANTYALLAESVHPHGIEAFEPVLQPVWSGLKHSRGRALASFLRCLGSTIPLMHHNPAFSEYANYYTKELVQIMSREFSSPDDDMKKSILRILAQLPLSKALFPKYRTLIVGPFLKSFWTRRVAADSSQLYRLVVDATFSLATKLDVAFFVEKLTPLAKDANENLRRMSADAMNRILVNTPDSVVELDPAQDASLVDALLYAFQEQSVKSVIYIKAFSTATRVLGTRMEPHLPEVLSSLLYRLKSSEAEVRQQSADLVSAIAPAISLCSHGDTTVMKKLIFFLYEQLGEVFPEVLGSIIGALFACIQTMDRNTMYTLENPSVSVLLPTLTPILKNRHEKVQEQCIKLVGLIASRNPDTINAKEWMRVCFDLLDMLKSQRKRIRVAANATFGEIAKTIGPQDVLAMLLDNLKVQERQLRVCTAVAIGIVADTCAPFTVLPALMNEYQYPDKNVQNGVLKSLSFLFEYLDGHTIKDYLFAITPLLENALTDRDQVHRQIAADVVSHIALNSIGHVHNDHPSIFVHLLNLVLPNIYESSPHVIARILASLHSLYLVLGPGLFMNYVWSGLFQAARKVRGPYWKVYNAAYVHNCDQLVPFYPRFESLEPMQGHSEGQGHYNIQELDLWI